LRERYRKLGETQGVRFGQGGRIPDFNAEPARRPPVPEVTAAPAEARTVPPPAQQ